MDTERQNHLDAIERRPDVQRADVAVAHVLFVFRVFGDLAQREGFFVETAVGHGHFSEVNLTFSRSLKHRPDLTIQDPAQAIFSFVPCQQVLVPRFKRLYVPRVYGDFS